MTLIGRMVADLSFEVLPVTLTHQELTDAIINAFFTVYNALG